MRTGFVGSTLAQVLAMGRGRLNTMPKAFIASPPNSIITMSKKKKKKAMLPVVTETQEQKAQADTQEPKPESESKPEEAKPEEKKSKKKMKKWPDDGSVLVDYQDLAAPLKSIINQGYRLFRKDQKEFEYEGYNIGPNELRHFPPPKYRFTEQLLDFDNKRGKKLIDVILNVMFLLGVEQGRRAERRDHKPMELVLHTMDKYRDENKNLRLKIDELEVTLELKSKHPQLDGEALKIAISDGVRKRRDIRLHQARKELGIDPVRSAFEFKTPKKVKFRDLERLARSLNKNICSMDQWKELLKERGWTFEEWKSRCKKKSINTDFS